MSHSTDGAYYRKSLSAGFYFAVIAILLILSSNPAGGQSAKAAPTKSDISSAGSGKALFTSSGCYECHGRVGQGSRFSGARIGPPNLDLPGFIQYVRQPTGQMPPYTSKVLSDAELSQVYTFLKSVPPPPSVKDIPLLQ